MSMRLVKQQLAALSSKACTGCSGIEKKKAVTDDPKRRSRKRKKESQISVEQKKAKSSVELTNEQIETANLEYLRRYQPAEESMELMSKVLCRIGLIRRSLLRVHQPIDRSIPKQATVAPMI